MSFLTLTCRWQDSKMKVLTAVKVCFFSYIIRAQPTLFLVMTSTEQRKIDLLHELCFYSWRLPSEVWLWYWPPHTTQHNLGAECSRRGEAFSPHVSDNAVWYLFTTQMMKQVLPFLKCDYSELQWYADTWRIFQTYQDLLCLSTLNTLESGFFRVVLWINFNIYTKIYFKWT